MPKESFIKSNDSTTVSQELFLTRDELALQLKETVIELIGDTNSNDRLGSDGLRYSIARKDHTAKHPFKNEELTATSYEVIRTDFNTGDMYKEGNKVQRTSVTIATTDQVHATVTRGYSRISKQTDGIDACGIGTNEFQISTTELHSLIEILKTSSPIPTPDLLIPSVHKSNKNIFPSHS